jgi:hypothetical protein
MVNLNPKYMRNMLESTRDRVVLWNLNYNNHQLFSPSMRSVRTANRLPQDVNHMHHKIEAIMIFFDRITHSTQNCLQQSSTTFSVDVNWTGRQTWDTSSDAASPVTTWFEWGCNLLLLFILFYFLLFAAVKRWEKRCFCKNKPLSNFFVFP